MTNLLRDFRNKKKEQVEKSNVAADVVVGSTAMWRATLEERIKTDPGVDLLGVARVHPQLYFEWDFDATEPMPKWIIVLLRHMDYDEFSNNLKEEAWFKNIRFWRRKWVRTIREVMQVYADVHESAICRTTLFSATVASAKLGSS